MPRVFAIAGAVVADAVRRKVLYLVGFFGIVMAIAIPSLPSYGTGIVQGYFREVALALTYLVAIVLALALSVNRIPGEVERRTVYNILGKRVARWEYVVGSWLGVVAVLACMVAAMIVVVQGVALVMYHQPMWRLWEGGFGVWLESSVVAGFAVAVSAMTGPVAVTVASLALLFIGHVRGYLADALGPELVRFYPSLDTLNVINPVAHGTGVGPIYLATMLAVAVGWWIVSLVVGVLAFQRKDL